MLMTTATASADAGKWTVDFSSGEFPFGTTTEGSFFFSGNSGYTVGTVTIYSPKLNIQEGETLRINARSSSYYATPTLKVSVSTNKETWTEHKDFSNLVTTTAQDFVDSDLPTGIQYVKIELNSLYLYALEGPTVYYADDDVDVKLTVPETAMVNNEMTISASLTNLGLSRAADEYEIRLQINNQIVAYAEPMDFESHATRNVTFKYTPHETGTLNVWVVYGCGDFFTWDVPKDVVVSEEIASAEAQVGTANGNDMSVPISFMYKKTHAETIYTADDLKLKNGDKISQIAFHGYSTSAKTVPVKIWAANTEATAFSANYSIPFSDTSEMTLIYDGTATFRKAGTRSGSTYNCEAMVEFELAEPFVYTGNSIKFVYEKQENDDGGLRYETSSTLKTTSPSAYTGANITLPTTMSIASATPILYLSVANDPLTVNGTITNKKNGNAVEGVKVTLKSDNVEYYATTDSEGKYTVNVIQTARDYQLTTEKEGFFPATENISFAEGVSITKDIELIESKDLFITEVNIPAETVVNNDYTATITIRNVNPTTFAASDYTVKYIVGAEEINVETQDIPAGETVTLQVTDTMEPEIPIGLPRKAENIDMLTAYFTVAFGEETLESDKVEIAVYPEELTEEVAAGAANSSKNSAPLYLWYKASQSESLYPAELLQDVVNGSRITALTYRGDSREQYTVNANVKVWMENVENGTLEEEGRSTDEMEQMFEGVVTLEASKNQVMTITLDKPFIYTGGDIRIVMQHTAEEECNTYFESDNRYAALAKNGDTFDEMAGRSYFSTELPVCYMTIDNSATVSGTIFDCYDNPLEAEIVLNSGKVTYMGKSNADGTYSIPVGRKDLTYTLYARYIDDMLRFEHTANISFADGDVVENIVFAVDPTYTVDQLTTVCLPMSLDTEAAAAAGKFYELYYVDEENINFLRVYEVEEGVPYLFVPALERPFTQLHEAAKEKAAGEVSKDNVTFNGVMADAVTLSTDAEGIDILVMNDGTFSIAESETKVYPFHAYLAKAEDILTSDIKLWEEPNAIADVVGNGKNDSKAIYTIDGRRVENTQQKGVYIVNGKKIVIK